MSRENNQQGRCAGSFRDGQFTRYIEVVDHVIVITDSDKDAQGNPVERHRNYDLTGPDLVDFQPLSVTSTKSGRDSKLIITFGGFTVNTQDSRRVTVKTDLVVAEPWEVYSE